MQRNNGTWWLCTQNISHLVRTLKSSNVHLQRRRQRLAIRLIVRLEMESFLCLHSTFFSLAVVIRMVPIGIFQLEFSRLLLQQKMNEWKKKLNCSVRINRFYYLLCVLCNMVSDWLVYSAVQLFAFNHFLVFTPFFCAYAIQFHFPIHMLISSGTQKINLE